MKNIIKTKDFEFELELPNPSVEKHLLDWVKLIDKQNKQPKQDEWVTLPFLPKYKFKNLIVKHTMNVGENFEAETSINFICDEFEKESEVTSDYLVELHDAFKIFLVRKNFECVAMMMNQFNEDSDVNEIKTILTTTKAFENDPIISIPRNTLLEIYKNKLGKII